MLRGNSHHSATQRVKVRGQRGVLRGIHLIRGNEKRLPRATEELRQLRIERLDARACIHYEHEHARAFHGHAGLAEDFRRDAGLFVGQQAARIHDFEGAAVPLRNAVNAVAGDARFVRHDRAAAFREPVEQRGFAHVGPAQNHHRGKLNSHSIPLSSRAMPRVCV